MNTVCAIIALSQVLSASPADAGAEKGPALTQEEKLARGKYLVTIVGCTECHTPHVTGAHGAQLDVTMLFAGHPETRGPSTPMSWAYCNDETSTARIGPWGTSFTRNLTPDMETGLGRWTEKNFLDTMRTGRRLGTGRRLLEPMPWRRLSVMRDDDLKAIFAYLKTVKPIKNHVPNPVPPKFAPGTAAEGTPVAPDAVPEQPANAAPLAAAELLARGKYLVTIVGCNDCHTPHVAGSEGPTMDSSLMLSGHPGARDPKKPLQWAVCSSATSTAVTGPWGTTYTRNLTPDKDTGIGNWTEQNFVDTMRTGRRMGKGRQLLEPMPWRWFAEMTDEDLGSIYAYLMTLKPIKNHVPEPKPPTTDGPAMAPQGRSGGK